MRTIVIFLVLLINGYTLLAQEKKQISLKVIDCNTGDPLPFTNVYNLESNEGTATNFDGFFNFYCLPGDTLHFSFLGYQSKSVMVRNLFQRSTICLQSKSVALEAVEITETSDFLYSMVQGCRKNRFTLTRRAKMYLYLKSTVNKKQVELLEAYYNGFFKDYDLQSIHLKIGRIFLAPYSNSFYLSLSTSSGINLHNTFERNAYFPTSPPEMKRKSMLKKYFDLNFKNKFSQNGNTVYVIDFSPRKNLTDGFSGTVWVDSSKSELLKVKLKNKNGELSPFLPLGKENRIDSISFDITKSYKRVKGQNNISTIDFNYTLYYYRPDGKKIKAETEAVLFAYDYSEEFILPFFEKEYKLNDYQAISLAPNNTFFWENNSEFKLNNIELEKQLFIEKSTTNYVDSFSIDPITDQVSLKKSAFRTWSPRRIKLANYDKTLKGNEKIKFASIYHQYKLDGKIFMDINTVNDSLHVQLASILDGYNSYSYLPRTAESSAFINMYFDLLEIEKRKLQKEIKGMNEASIIEAYKSRIKSLKILENDFFSSTLGGKNYAEMERWNSIILDELNIDNLSIFGLMNK